MAEVVIPGSAAVEVPAVLGSHGDRPCSPRFPLRYPTISFIAPGGGITVITPAHAHWQVLAASRTLKLFTFVFRAPGFHGPVVTGMQGIGVSTPSAADVAAATCGFDSDMQAPNGMMFAIGAKSITVATSFPSNITGGPFGITVIGEGAIPNEHLILSPNTTGMPIRRTSGECFQTVGRAASALQADFRQKTPTLPTHTSTPEPLVPKVIVQSLPDYAHAQLLTATGRSLVADEPSAEGGDDLGPTPYELLLWALGACTSMTLQIYARRKGIPLEEVAVEVEHSRLHADDCDDCLEEHTGRIEVLHRRIVLRGNLTDEQRDELLGIARRCPVHKTIRAAVEVIDSVELVH